MDHQPAPASTAYSMPATPLAGTGLHTAAPVHANLTAAQLVTHALRRGEGRLSAEGALIVKTGVHTGRSVQDKFSVDDPGITNDIWWRPGNRKLDPAHFQTLKGRVQAYLQGRELFTQDLYAGADPAHRVRVRLVSTEAWHTLFARNMFIRPQAQDLAGFVPDYVILHAPNMQADPATDGVRSGTAIAVSFTERMVVIAGSEYGGEIKKSIFGVMNWKLPAEGVLPMHCSANVGRTADGSPGDVALFFGLSGTGKTTLSSDPNRPLIGDDEHGWGPNGVFNFEGGCYAKCIGLRRDREPQIYDAIRFGAVLENVTIDPHSRKLDYADGSLTENTRAAYPLEHIGRVAPGGVGGHPQTILLLSADAFGVLPPVARLSTEQALRYFLAGYTAKLAGTEAGMGSEPEATFSACFAAPFIPLPPSLYADMLRQRIERHGTRCFLVNTGWSGGPYGVGERISLDHTRAMVRAAISGALDGVPTWTDPVFGLTVPESVPDVPDGVLRPRQTWADGAAYDRAAAALAERFRQNAERF